MAGEAFEKIVIDLMGPSTKTNRENTYIIIGIDYSTKNIIVDAIKEKTAAKISEFIFKLIIFEHGCPNSILTDNGREFKNAIVENLCNKMNIHKKYKSPYRPQTNGLVERTNQTLLAILAKNVIDEKQNLDVYIQIIRFNYNIRHQKILIAARLNNIRKTSYTSTQ